ncbi:MAG TPA: hypothetical protein VK929_01985 [Longimicrobiales bacterium]|nr:hypothetical protein [Longimicrobiales bacterium]
MQSETRIAQAVAALTGPRQAFRSALIAAIDEVTSLLAAQRAPAAERAGVEAVRLGVFADGHIDAERFSSLVQAGTAMDPAQQEQLEHALRILRSFAAQGDDLFVLKVRRGADLRDSVRDALASRGRAFNTAHQVEILRSGRQGVHVELEYGTMDFRHWTRRERRIAPPLVVEVSGADVQPAALAEYMDGAQKIVLMVEGRAAPAALARLIAPHTFVMQSANVEDVARLAAFDGPGVAAIVDDPKDFALFVHDPSRGRRLSQRLTVESVPEKPRGRVAGISADRQVEELLWLAELQQLAELAATQVAGESEAGPVVTPADQLAAWLLRQTDLAAAE